MPANPTNINVPPAKAADPTNVNVPVHGTKFPSGITGADQFIDLVQGSDLGISQTAKVVDQFTAKGDWYVRFASHMNVSTTATASFDVYNLTTSTAVISSTTPTSGTGGTTSTINSPTISDGDVIQLRITTDGTGAAKGVRVKLYATQLAGSTTNPV